MPFYLCTDPGPWRLLVLDLRPVAEFEANCTWGLLGGLGHGRGGFRLKE